MTASNECVARIDTRIKVFISYSRRDTNFAHKLASELTEACAEPFLDSNDIAPAEPWQERLGSLIETADTVIFIISPDSTSSRICAWELEEAERLGKRLIPVLARMTPDDALPAQVGRLNYIPMESDTNYRQGFERLLIALQTDLGWIREHTRIGELAARWIAEGGGHSHNLLHGKAILDAEIWAASRPPQAPAVNDRQRSFLTASQDAEARRIADERAQIERTRRFQRRASWAIGAIAFMVMVAAVAAVRLVRESERTEVRVLTSIAQTAINNEEYERALRVAVLGAPRVSRSPIALGWDTEEMIALETKLAGAAQSSALLREMHGHTGPVRALTFSENGQRLATASDDKSVRIWNGATGQLLLTLVGHQGAVRTVRFLDGDRAVLSASLDGTVRIWDTQTGNMIRSIAVGSPISDASLTIKGEFLATGSEDGIARLWDVGSGNLLQSINSGFEEINSVALSSQTLTLAAAASDGIIRIWNAADGNLKQELSGHQMGVLSISFSRDEARAFTTSADRSIGVWDMESGQLIKFLEGHQHFVMDAVLDEPRRRMFSAGGDGNIHVWDLTDGTTLRRLRGSTPGVLCIDYSIEHEWVASGSVDGVVRLWDAKMGEPELEFEGHRYAVVATTFSPDNRFVATGAYDNTAKIWRSDTGALVSTLVGHEAGVNDVAYSPDGALLATAADDGTARIWDMRTYETLAILKDGMKRVWSVQFASDGNSVVTASDDGIPRLWLRHGGLVRRYPQHSKLRSTIFFGDGQQIASLSSDGNIGIFNQASGDTIRTTSFGKAHELAPEFSPNFEWVFASHGAGAAIYDWVTGIKIAELRGNVTGISSARFSPDSTRLATSSWDYSVRLWDTRTGELIRTFRGHKRAASAVAFDRSGDRLVSTSRDNTRSALVWNTRLGTSIRRNDLVKYVCERSLAGTAQRFSARDFEDAVLSFVADAPCLLYEVSLWKRLRSAGGELFRTLTTVNSSR